MLFRPDKMVKVNILLLARDMAKTTRLLGHAGLLHLVDATAQSTSKLLQGASQEGDSIAVASARNQVNTLIAALGLDVAEGEAETTSSQEEWSLSDITSLVEKISAHYTEQTDVLDALLEKSGAVSRRYSETSQYPLQSVSLDALHNLSHFFMATGRLSPEVLPRTVLTLGDKAMLIVSDTRPGDVLVLASNKNRWSVQEQLKKLGFAPFATPDGEGTASEEAEQASHELEQLRNDIDRCRLNLLKLSEQYGGILLLLRKRLNELTAVEDARKLFGKVSKLYCISGWTPEEKLPELRALIEQSTEGSGVMEVIPAEQDASVQAGLEEVPVKLRGGPLAKAFQMLVCNFGIPDYHEIDPTLFVGLTFTLFFGYMFGDVGQGLVLFLAGLWMRFGKKSTQFLRDASPLLMVCGISAVCFGFAYGSVFGSENLLPHLWLNPLQERGITEVLMTAVGIGIVVSSVAILINIVNHFLARRYFEGVFDRFGLLGLLFYWLALGVGLTSVKTGRLATSGIVVIGIPLLLLALRGPLARLLHRDEEHGGLLNLILGCLLDLMETITGYMSGTVSFVRIGAFAISHAALCLAIYSIVRMLKSLPGGSLYSLLIIIGGNLLVIGFEGMVAMIQGLRLEYYELFGKFYHGTGVAYKPFLLDKQS